VQATRPAPNEEDIVRTPHRRLTTAAAILLLAATAAACGSDDASDLRDRDQTEDTRSVDTDPDDTRPSRSTTTTEATDDTTGDPTTTTEAADTPGGAVRSLQDVRSAVVQIEAVGTFVDPEFGAVEGAGRGSGFVIDPSGIAVTNNHVVTGAGLLQVAVDGEDEPRNARVLGVSECSDLAVIQIDGGDLPYLEWAPDADQPGTEIYVAGFPLGDPEYTLTRGVIAKSRAGGDTNWASIDHTLEHDAAAQPGNSGGPLVTPDGQVAGIHYASYAQTNQSQFRAIAADIAQPIVEELATGVDIDSIGVNGQIVQSEDGSLSGLWVSGVASGSPADEVGLQPGDIVTRIEGVSIGLDGTMRDYCDVLRSHAPDDQLAIEVLRFATEEQLDGELNGDILTQTFSFADDVDDDPTEPGDPGAVAPYTSYVDIVDDSNAITVSVPDVWADVSGAPIDIGDGTQSPAIVAATSIDGFSNTWSTPGVQFIASPTLTQLTPEQLLDELAPADCTSTGREAYDDSFFVGAYEVFESCGGTATRWVQVAAHSADGAYAVLVGVQVVSEADLEALDVILGSFNVVM
jgi:serine protease Do